MASFLTIKGVNDNQEPENNHIWNKEGIKMVVNSLMMEFINMNLIDRKEFMVWVMEIMIDNLTENLDLTEDE